MSAWIVSDLHIDAIVRGLCRRELVSGLSPTVLGRILWRENVTSIHYRYADTAENDSGYPGTFPDWTQSEVDKYVYQVPPDDTQAVNSLLNSATSYDYQSCEHPAYRASDAAKYVRLLVVALAKEGAISNDTVGWSLPWRKELTRTSEGTPR